MMRSNVRPFKRPDSSSPFQERVLAAVCYGAMAWLMTMVAVDRFLVIMLLGVLYYAFVKRGTLSVPYFVRFHYLQSLVLCMLVYCTLLLLNHSVMLLESLFALIGITQYIQVAFSPLLLGVHYLNLFGLLVIGLSQVVVALFGKTPRIPLVTPNVLYWT